MEIKQIEEKIKGRQGHPLGVKRKYAVLLPLVEVAGDWHILYEVRAAEIRQPGEVSFPGGGVEAEESFKEAAIRETCEELKVQPEQIELIGELDYLITPYNMILYAYVGKLHVNPETIRPNSQEVAEVFTVPVQFFLENPPKIATVKTQMVIDEDFPFHLIPNGKDYNWREGKYLVHFYEYGEQVIWGMTARLTEHFIQILQD